jgi:nucleoside-diphosphate-sugar epimerase
MRVLLTGSSGWLGRRLAPRLREAGHDPLGLDIAPGPQTDVVGSVADAALIHNLFQRHEFQGVIHAGALHKPDILRENPQAFVDTNTSGTLTLLEAARRAACDRFVFTSTTSLMISLSLREAREGRAVWLDETFAPLEPRNIYGVTKLAAEGLCRLYAQDHGLGCIVLRTGRFFPEDDDTLEEPSGPNLKANEFLNRRLTVDDAAEAHLVALEHAPALGFGLFIISAPTPFQREDAEALWNDAPAVIARRFPDAAELYAREGWRLPPRIDRIYDSSLAERKLGFRCRTDFGAVLEALRRGSPLPFEHDPTYLAPRLANGLTNPSHQKRAR